MAALLPLDAFFIELRAVSFGYQARVGKEYVESFGLSEDGGTYAALTSAEYYKSVPLYSIANSPKEGCYLILSVMNVSTAKSIERIQNRVTIFGSAIALRGRLMSAGIPSFWKW